MRTGSQSDARHSSAVRGAGLIAETAGRGRQLYEQGGAKKTAEAEHPQPRDAGAGCTG